MHSPGSMPPEYVDANTMARLRASTYLHGGGTGDAGLQVTLVSVAVDRLLTVRLPGPVAEEWLTAVLAALRSARGQAAVEPWGREVIDG